VVTCCLLLLQGLNLTPLGKSITGYNGLDFLNVTGV
jgi:hypothetical protein